MTMDVDIVLAMDEPNLRAFLGAASDLGLEPVAPVKIDALLNTQMRKAWVTEKHMIAFALRPRDPKGPTVDVLIDPRIDVAESLKRAENKIIEGVRVPLAAVEDMISQALDRPGTR